MSASRTRLTATELMAMLQQEAAALSPPDRREFWETILAVVNARLRRRADKTPVSKP